MTNKIIRQRAQENSVRLWQIAERVGITDGNFSRRLRQELPDTERDRLLAIIDELAAEKEAQNVAENAND